MQRNGLFNHVPEGISKGVDVKRNKTTKTRLELFGDLFFSKFGNVFKINVLIFLFFLPLCLVLFLSASYGTVQSILYPFGANLGVGYPAIPDMQGVAELLDFKQAVYTVLTVMVTSVVAAVGLAGGGYSIRRFIWTEGEYSAKEFFKGVKLNFKNAVQTALFFSVVLTITLTAIYAVEFNAAMGIVGVELVLLRISQVLCYILLAIAAFMSFWMLSLGVNYDIGFFKLIKNAFFMSVGTFPQTILFGTISILPFAIFLWEDVGRFSFVAVGGLVTCFFSFTLLVWFVFSQWVLDQYITPKSGKSLKKEQKATQVSNESKNKEKKSRLTTKAIQPIDDGVEVEELPQSYSRADLKKNKAQKQALEESAEAYENANEVENVDNNG